MTVEATIEMNSQPVTPEDQVRAELYSLIGNLLLAVPSQITLDQLSQLQGEDGDVGSVVNALAQVAKSMNPAAVEREFNILFIGMGRGEVLPYASYYLTGFLHEKKIRKV